MVMMTQRARSYVRLGQALRQARRSARLSQDYVADIAGVSQTYISSLEAGTRRPDPAVLRKLAAALGLTYEQLAPLAGYMPEPPDGPQTLTVAAEKAGPLRRLAELPAEWLIAAERMARIAYLTGVPPQSDSEPGGQHDQMPEQHKPDMEPEGPSCG